MAVTNNQTQNDSTKVDSTSIQTSPYLPTQQGFLKEISFLIHSSIAYWKWKRVIQKHAPNNSYVPTELNILDAGCGPGKFINCLRRWFPNANISGLDMSKELLDYASQRTERITWLKGSAEQIPLDDNFLDVLSCLQVIEHLKHPEAFLNEANRVLRPDGLLLMATPNPEGLGAKLLKQKWQGIRDDHISLRPLDQWRKTLDDSGFKIINEGTTLFNGIPVIGQFPFSLPFQFLQAIFGWFPWKLGESYMVVLKRNG